MKKLLFITVTLFFIAINARGEDGDVFAEYTVEGVLMRFRVISEEEKTCQVWSSAIENDTEGKVTIPSTSNGYTVKAIGDYAFSYCKKITEVSIPNGVERIGLGAFDFCSLLETITIPDAVYNIGGGAFYGTKWLDNQPNGLVYAGKVLYMYKGSMPTNASLSLRNGTTSIANSVFNNCSNLVSINIPNSVKHIGSGAFEGCSNLVTVNLPQSLVSLGDYAFYGCSKITTISIPDLLSTIDEGTFMNCYNLSEVTIGKGLTAVKQYAFEGCVNIKKLLVDCKSLEILHWELKNNIEELIIGDNSQFIGYNTFCGCSSLKKVFIGENIRWVEGFSGCTSLEEVVISEGNSTIQGEAFNGCNKLSQISLPTTLTEIGYIAFSDCGFEEFHIPESVSSIGYGAFQACANLKSINIPSKITRLEDYLLSGTGFTSFDIPSHVTSLGMGVFSGCTKLESITASENLISVGRDAFTSTPWLENRQNGVFYLGSVACGYHGEMPENTTIRLEDTTRGIAACAFADLSNLSGIVFPSELNNIGYEAFKNSGLTSVTIPEGLVDIGCETFAYCHNLRKIVLYDTPDYGCYNFFNCINLTAIYAYMEHPKPLGESYFYDDWEENWFDVYNNATLYVPEEYESIYENTNGWKKFKNIQVIPDYIEFADASVKAISVENWDTNGDGELDKDEAAAVTTIGIVFANKAITSFNELQYFTGLTSLEDYAFFYCSELNSVAIPNNITSIGESAFNGCSSLSSITIGSGVQSINRQAFWNCFNLYSVNISSLEAWCNIAFEDIYANPVSLGHHLYLDNVEIKDMVIPDGVTSIGNHAFTECGSLTSLTIGEGVTSIGKGAFSYCCGLTSVTIGNNVETIGEGAFSGCNNMTTINIGNGLFAIGFQAFESCDKLTSVNISSLEAWCNIEFEELSNPLQYAHHLYVDGKEITDLVIPNGVKSIGSHAFRECNLNSVTIGDNVKTIGNWAFAHCHDLVNLSTSEGLRTIGDYAFFYCEGLTSLAIPNSVTRIGESAFGSCKGITSLNLGNGISSTGVLAFTECTNLTSVTIPENVTTIDHGSFQGCSGLRSVSFPNSVTTICDYAFMGCSSLASISIPPSVITIGEDGAFWGCSSLTSIVLPSSVTSIGCRTFYECTSLTSVTIPNSVTSFDDLFYGCNSLTSVTVGHEIPVSINAYTFPNRANATLYVPYGCKAVYEASNYWKEFKQIIEIEDSEHTDISQIDNALYVKPTEVLASKHQFELHIQLKNNVEVAGASFTVELPEGMTLAKDEVGDVMYQLNGERARSNKFSVYWTENENGTWSFRIMPTGTSIISGTDGTLLTLIVNMAETLDAGEYPVILKDNSLTIKDGEGQLSTLELENTRTTLTVSDVITGDVNGDERIDLTDAIMIVYASLGVVQTGFIEKAADVNSDNRIDLTDAIIVVYKSLGVEKSRALSIDAARMMLVEAVANEGFIINDVTIKPGGTVELPIGFSFTSDNTVVGFQLNLNLPDGVTTVKDEDGLPEYTKDETACGKLTIYPTESNGFAALPQTTNASIKGTEGTLFTITLRADEENADREETGPYTATVTNAMFTIKDADGTMHTVDIDDFTFNITVKEDNTTTDISGAERLNGKPDEVYDLQGRIRSNGQMHKGLMIVRGNDGIIRKMKR